jgi:hypothetical protein
LRKERKLDNLIIYLLRASAGMIIIYLFFILLNRNDTFYKSNRIILLMSLIIPVILPLLKISHSQGGAKFAAQEIFLTIASTAGSINIYPESAAGPGSFVRFLISSWFIVTLILFVKILISLIRTASIIRKGSLIRSGFPRLVITEEKVPPFSLFPYAVIPESIYNNGDSDEIAEHEYTHIRQGHTFDIFLCEFVLAFFWFNPAVWFIRRSIILNHEYLADKNIVQRTHNIREYQYQLLKVQTGVKRISLANSFNSLIKNRIIMINKKPTPVVAILKNLLIIPVVAFLFSAFSFTTTNDTASRDKQEKMFSDESAIKLLRFIGENTRYPFAARSNKVTGKIYVEIAMDKGGKIRKIDAFNNLDKVKSPLIQEVVIVGYSDNLKNGNGKELVTTNTKISGDNLSEECLRVARLIESLDLPEWKDKDLDFTLVINFVLK